MNRSTTTLPFRRSLLSTTLLLLAWLGAASACLAAAPKDSDCLECHTDKTLTKTNAAGKAISLFVDEARYKKSVHATNTCAGCHADLTDKHPDDNLAAKPVDCSKCHATQSDTYQRSVHALALKAGKQSAATCLDCHGKHDILRYTSPESPLHFTKLATTCGECHSEVTDQVRLSVHGRSTAAGHREAATCIDCHSEHKIVDLRDSSSWKISQEVCSKCHASESLNTKFRLPADRVRTFQDSYHGLASQYGSVKAANCGSCHGTHLVLPSTDPRSTIHTNNLVHTCGKCHPGATENFVQGKVHMDTSGGGDLVAKINAWVRRVYLWIIVATIGVMLAHNFLAWRHKAMAAFNAADRSVLRMDLSQRIQHFGLAASFIILALTGFALKYPDTWLAYVLGGNETFRRLLHRGAGAVMLLLGVYHVGYLMMSKHGRRLFIDLLPRAQDARDVVTNAKYLLWRGWPKAKFGRFGYPEKLEYWAVIWGTIIMGVTGLMIWFKIDVTQWLPRWAVDVATTIHYYEAILACLAIVVWHFYHVFFDPDVYPINWAWWDGRVTTEWQKHEHPLDTSVTPAPAPTEKKQADVQPPKS